MKYLLFLWLIGCGSAYQSPETKGIVDEFEATYNRDTRGVSITFVDSMPGLVVGLCYRSQFHRDITILTSYWSTHSDTSRRNLLFHELGHCVFDREHTSEVYPDQCPKSLMNPSVISDICYHTHSFDLTHELPGQ